MKQSALRTFTSLVKGIFRGKREEAVAMETYLGCIPTIQRLIDKHLLGINLKERLLVIDLNLHLMYISTRTGRAMTEADRRYAAFIDKVVAYMNFQLGRMGARDFIDPKKEPIRFLVTQKELRYFDAEGNPLPAHLQVNERTLFVGMYKNGEVNYREYGGN
jgi:hypothetical protein